MVYEVYEIERIAHVAFKLAQKRSKKLCSIDKANVLDVSQLWRDTVTKISTQYPDVDCHICMLITVLCNLLLIQNNLM